jgi:DNA invertase Pin-like site-specific DNA recombinase
MAVIAYLRVSKKGDQDTKNQKLAILEFAQKEGIQIDQWIEISISSRKSVKERRIDELMGMLSPCDMLICAELSRLGRSVGQIAQIVDTLVKNEVAFISLKEGIRLNGKKNMAATVQITMFSLFAEIERELISERTKEGLARAREEGKLLGRPKGKGKSKLDDFKDEIIALLKVGVPKARIAEKYKVHISTFNNWFSKNEIDL